MSPLKNRNRILPLDPKDVGETQKMFDEVQAKFGMVPNPCARSTRPQRWKLISISAARCMEWLFDTKVQEQIGLAVAECNVCDDCLSAHII
jgi:alkylhydroperoxidase family enzyme